MKPAWLARLRRGHLVPAALLLVLAGCATHRIDWAARAGNYTLDQAILEFGPPDKQASLQDGTLVADWLTRRGYYYAHPVYGYHHYFPDWYYSPTFVERSPDYFLRLTFSPEGKLKAWKEFAR